MESRSDLHLHALSGYFYLKGIGVRRDPQFQVTAGLADIERAQERRVFAILDDLGSIKNTGIAHGVTEHGVRTVEELTLVVRPVARQRTVRLAIAAAEPRILPGAALRIRPAGTDGIRKEPLASEARMRAV